MCSGWRIGDGASVNLWNAQWIPGSKNRRLKCRNITTKYTLAADLINHEKGTWCEDAVREIADATQVDAILSTLLSRLQIPDIRIWRVHGSVVYTVKSGYRLLTQSKLPKQNIPNDSTGITATTFFTKLWSLQLPQKIKIHLWKTYRNFLPTFTNLEKRHLSTSSACLMCSDKWDSVDHILSFCLLTIQVMDALHITRSTVPTRMEHRKWLIDSFMMGDDLNRKILTVTNGRFGLTETNYYTRVFDNQFKRFPALLLAI
ncbi:hypothetical protein PVK06_043051 [Gossypium arboreum]|uniref:Reverse transcriptase zinc-binding domain-containing protein n=1 Tax=Gossypium arboreum TaxID=29729 RepID=A0ABR0MMH2_GOSAR|nr:hypothetical protein PVK06_043051 [Gossypium arboreum]